MSEGIIIALIAATGTVLVAIIKFMRPRHQHKSKQRDQRQAEERKQQAKAEADEPVKKRLRDFLNKKPPAWKKFETLMRLSGKSAAITEQLLHEIGARRSIKENNVWTIES